MDNYTEYILLASLVVLFIIIPLAVIGDNDARDWRTMIRQADQFEYHHHSTDYTRTYMYLYDESHNYICEAVMDMAGEKVRIDRHSETILWHYGNRRKSHKMFKLLYPKIPQEVRDRYVPKDKLMENIKKLK